ncbi:DUF4426 domain-containing protein [Endozoicomonas sp.]|nr:DUF4426 domain-containing protein [Endozoicomonas sp.]
MLANLISRCRSVWVFAFFIAATASANKEVPEARLFSTEPVRIGHYDVYYSTFNSRFLTPDVAAAYQLERNPRTGILNIAIRDVKKSELGKAVTGRLTGETSNLLSQTSGLSFHEIKEGNAIYYLASFRFTNEESLKLAIEVQPDQQPWTEKIAFRHTFFEG